MDIGKMNDNYTFYEGYEGEPEIVLRVAGTESAALHIWEGYIEDLFAEPMLTGNGWSGFTRDIHEFRGAFSDDAHMCIDDVKAYLTDLDRYKDSRFEYPETSLVMRALCDLLHDAAAHHWSIVVERNE